MYRTLERGATWLAKAMAIAGGVALIVLTVLTCVSILGRAFLALGLGPIQGIYEITEMAVAAAVFAFLPWTQLNRGHAAVDLLKPVLGRLNKPIDLSVDIAMTFVGAIGTWRMWLGMQDRQRYGDTTQILDWPVWPGYALALVGAGAFTLVAAFCVIRSARALGGTSQ